MRGPCYANGGLIVGLVVLLSTLEAMAAKGIPITTTYFFGDDFTDISNITWAHAVNSIAELEKALSDDVMMIEADISLGTVNGTGPEVPIMAHPPSTTSDLSFEDFIGRIIKAVSSGAKKGAKLDFKDIKTVEPCLKLMKQLRRKITFPVWLNADVLSGPVNSTGEPVNATEFLSLAKEYSPDSMLSLGWKTNFGCDIRGKYEKDQILEMINLLDDYERQVPPTFPVRAGLAAESIDELVLLVATVPRSTLTLWASASDPVDMDHLKQLIEEVGTNRLYIDLPFDLSEGPGTVCKDSGVVVHNDTAPANSTDPDNRIDPHDNTVVGGAPLNLPIFTMVLVGFIALIFSC